MLKPVLLSSVLVVAFATSTSVAARDLLALKSIKVTLPDPGTLFPGDAAAEAINNNCLACHSADMVLNQPALPETAWQAEVQKMIKAYKAPVDQGDVAAIVTYLAKVKGTH